MSNYVNFRWLESWFQYLSSCAVKNLVLYDWDFHFITKGNTEFAVFCIRTFGIDDWTFVVEKYLSKFLVLLVILAQQRLKTWWSRFNIFFMFFWQVQDERYVNGGETSPWKLDSHQNPKHSLKMLSYATNCGLWFVLWLN